MVWFNNTSKNVKFLIVNQPVITLPRKKYKIYIFIVTCVLFVIELSVSVWINYSYPSTVEWVILYVGGQGGSEWTSRYNFLCNWSHNSDTDYIWLKVIFVVYTLFHESKNNLDILCQLQSKMIIVSFCWGQVFIVTFIYM